MNSQDLAGAGHVRTSVFADLKDIGSKFGVLATVIALFTTGVSTCITSLLQPYYTVGQVILLNVPMVASATILAMIVMRRPHAQATFWQVLWVVVAAIVIPYSIAWLFGLAGAVNPNLQAAGPDCTLGRGCLQPGPLQRDPGAGSLLQYLHPLRALMLIVDILLHYFSPARLPNTLSALASGIFIAWVFEFRLLPRVRKIVPAN
jgi:hypothetical protein